MLVHEEAQVAADHEEMKQLLVDDLVLPNRLIRLRVENVKCQVDLLPGSEHRQGRVSSRTRYSSASGRPATRVMPQRGHLPGAAECTSGSIGQIQSTSCESAARANRSSDGNPLHGSNGQFAVVL